MREKQWYQLSDESESIERFLLNYFEWYSLEETLNYCMQMKLSHRRHFVKLISNIRVVVDKCPERILRSFELLDQTPLNYPMEEEPNIHEIVILFTKIAQFLEDNQDVGITLDKKRANRTSKNDRQIRQIVNQFYKSLQEEFDGRLGI